MQRNLELKTGVQNISFFNAGMRPDAQLSQFSSDVEDIKLPLKVKGRLITHGSYPDKKYGSIQLTKDELKKSVNQWKNVKIYKSHRVWRDIYAGKNPSIDEVVGKITKTSWNKTDGGIDYEALIYDESVARKILGGLIDSISVGFMSNPIRDGEMVYKSGIEPKEASLVYEPRDDNATVQAA